MNQCVNCGRSNLKFIKLIKLCICFKRSVESVTLFIHNCSDGENLER